MITKNTYDELGQLISKNVGGTDATGATGLQTVDYSYNIRGWLKNINDIEHIGTDLFSFKINYDDYQSLGTNETLCSLLFLFWLIIQDYSSTIKGFALNKFKNNPVVYVFK